jgi:hypothetical protein
MDLMSPSMTPSYSPRPFRQERVLDRGHAQQSRLEKVATRQGQAGTWFNLSLQLNIDLIVAND